MWMKITESANECAGYKRKYAELGRRGSEKPYDIQQFKINDGDKIYHYHLSFVEYPVRT